jgi:hypothetical protein
MKRYLFALLALIAIYAIADRAYGLHGLPAIVVVTLTFYVGTAFGSDGRRP